MEILEASKRDFDSVNLDGAEKGILKIPTAGF